MVCVSGIYDLFLGGDNLSRMDGWCWICFFSVKKVTCTWGSYFFFDTNFGGGGNRRTIMFRSGNCRPLSFYLANE